MVGCPDRARLPKPAPRRRRLSGPEEHRVPGAATAAALDRPEDPGACLLLRAGVDLVRAAAARVAQQGNRAIAGGDPGRPRADQRGMPGRRWANWGSAG